MIGILFGNWLPSLESESSFISSTIEYLLFIEVSIGRRYMYICINGFGAKKGQDMEVDDRPGVACIF